MVHRQISRAFFARDTHRVARDLLGKLLIRRWRGKNIISRIVEVESYVGDSDRACHAARGKTKRNSVMFGEAGCAYVYLIYGMYNCLNIVTEKRDFPAAVLLRAAIPVTGDAGMSFTTPSMIELAGPGKLTRALHITRSQNKEDLTVSKKLYVADDGFIVAEGDVKSAPRIGIDYAGKDALLPWRYFIDYSK